MLSMSLVIENLSQRNVTIEGILINRYFVTQETKQMATKGCDLPNPKDKTKLCLVVAIDLGTTSSCYAYSNRYNYQKNPCTVFGNPCWSAQGVASMKTHSVILFNEHKKFHSFGYEAEDKYDELALDNEHHKWYFFKRFKMRLFDRQITRKMEIEDDNGKTMFATEVLGAAIKDFKDHSFKRIKTLYAIVKDDNIHWVLTVPAIWTDSAKQFMRESALKAGIHEGQLSLVLKPEAASLYFQMTPEDEIHGSEGAKFGATSPGTKHMVIDLGDKSSSLTIQERLNDGGFKEIHTRRVAIGSYIVNEEVKSMIVKIMGGTFLSKYQDENECDHLDWQRAFETKIRIITPKTSGQIQVKSPCSLLEAFESESGETVTEAFGSSAYAGKISWTSDKMIIDAEVFKNFFKPCTDKIVEHIKESLKHPDVEGTNIFLMVGGFSYSEMVQDAIMKAFPRVKVIIADDPVFAVVKGAVMFGHHPMCISSRNCPPYDSTILPDGDYIGS